MNLKIILNEELMATQNQRSFFKNADIEKGDFVYNDHFTVNKVLNPDINAYKVEMVSLESLKNAVGEDRNIKPIMGGEINYSSITIDKLMKDITLNGFKEALILVYDPEKEVAVIIEGNHRYEAAKRLGIKEVPVKLETMSLRSNTERAKDKMYPLATDKIGYKYKPILPSDLGYAAREIKDSDYLDIP